MSEKKSRAHKKTKMKTIREAIEDKKLNLTDYQGDVLEEAIEDWANDMLTEFMDRLDDKAHDVRNEIENKMQ